MQLKETTNGIVEIIKHNEVKIRQKSETPEEDHFHSLFIEKCFIQLRYCEDHHCLSINSLSKAHSMYTARSSR